MAAWLATFGLGGCVAVAPPDGDSSSTSSEDTAPTPTVFQDDDDPAVAALPVVESELLVQPYPGADKESLEGLYAAVGARAIAGLDDIGLTVLELSDGDLEGTAARLAQSGLVEAIHKNYVLQASASTNDPEFARQWYLTAINAETAWDQSVGREDLILAVVDTGVDVDHPDLAGRLLGGWNVYNGSSNFDDAMGHGTKVAGLLAAVSDNRTGISGLTWTGPLLAVRAAGDSGQTTSRHLAAGILWGLGQGAKIINVSFAPLWSNALVQSAVQQAFHRGAIVVISAGNEGGRRDAGGYTEAVFVSATDSFGTLAGFSDYGDFVDVAAPGTTIRSTALGGGYASSNGTSFAAPIVSGVLALAWSTNPDLRPVTVIEALADSAADLGVVGKDEQYGHGQVDAAAAVAEAARRDFEPDLTPPVLRILRPKAGARLRGRYVATASASDRWGVADVVMAIDGVPSATDTRSPYQLVIDTSGHDEGPHELTFVATDLAGNASTPQTVRVTFGAVVAAEAGIRVSFTSPVSGATVTSDVTIQAVAEAPAGLATAEWFVDGASAFVTVVSGNSAALSYRWRASSAARGTHTILLVITDVSGGSATGQLDLLKR